MATSVEDYAIELLADGAESTIEDDLNEDGNLSEEEHDEACHLAMAIVQAIRANPQVIIALARGELRT
jgi:hypothetical protein